jgi:site-specific recombinase XerD
VKHLHLIHGKYAVRVVVPVEFRGLVGKPELRRWVGSDRKAAERAAPSIIAEFYAGIDAAKSELAASTPTIRTAAQSHYKAELLADDRERSVAHGKTLALLKSVSAPPRATLLRLMIADQLGMDQMEALMGYGADAAIATGTAAETTDRRSLLIALAEVQLDAMSRFEERDAGKTTETPPRSNWLQEPDVPPVLADPPPSSRKTVASGRPLSDLLAEFHLERTSGKGSMSERTLAEHKVAVRMLEEFLGGRTAASNITRTDLQDYKRALMRTPANYRQRFPGLSLPDAITANDALKTPFAALNPQTINNKWLSHISSIMNWCFNEGLLTSNPARGVKVDEGKGYKEPTRAAFAQDDLQKMFGSPIFAVPKAYTSRQWALLIALFTGARSSSEIRRIKLSDIYLEQGILVFDLIEATKNTHSKRLVPVHKGLIRLGLPAYVEGLRKAGKLRLFEDWEPEDKINRWFLRTYKAEVGIIDPRKVFHSFRNTLKTALARHGVNRDVSDLITGHKDQSVGGIYITDANTTMITAMSEALNRVDFGLPSFGRR